MEYSTEAHELMILHDLYLSRVATARQLEKLLPPALQSETATRLFCLVEDGFVRERSLHIGGEVVFCLSRKGFDRICENGLVSGGEKTSPKTLWRRLEVSDMTILHELEIVDLRIAFESKALSNKHISQCRLETCLRGTKLTVGGGKRIFPDGRLRISTGNKDLLFYLEHDRGTETLKRLVQKVVDYSQVPDGQSGGPFRVLFVVPSEERRNNLALKLGAEYSDVKGLSLIATNNEVLKDPFGAIWLSPREAVDSCKQELRSEINSSYSAYRRSTNREASIVQGATLRQITA